MEKYEKIASQVLEAVGGKENVVSVLHCVTRLRFNLKDPQVPNDDEVKKIDGVMGCQSRAGQYQVIIGAEVGGVYDALCRIGGFAAQSAVDENLDTPAVKEKLTPKKIGANILDALAGCLTPVIPLIIGSSMFKMVVSLFGPLGAGLIAETSNLYVLLNMVGDAGFYFLPVAISYTAAKKFNADMMISLLMGFILVHPTLIGLVGSEFTVYGIPSAVQNYTSSVLPAILSVWVLSYVEKFIRKIVPKSLDLVFTTALTIVIMLPISLCVLGPAGNFIGSYVANFLFGLHDILGPVGAAAVAGLWGFLVLTGMHTVLVTQIMIFLSTTGDPYLLGALWCWVVSILAVAAAVAVKSKNGATKSLAITCLISGVTAGVSEPTLFGLCVRFKRPLATMAIGSAIGGFVSSLLGVSCNSILCAFTNFVGVLGWITSSSTQVLINWAVSCIVAFVATFVLTYMFGYTKEMDAQ